VAASNDRQAAFTISSWQLEPTFHLKCSSSATRGFRHVQVAVDAAELTIGFEHPGSAPVQGHRLPYQRWTFLQCSITDSISLIEYRVGARSGDSPGAGWSVSRPYPRTATRDPGKAAVRLTGPAGSTALPLRSLSRRGRPDASASPDCDQLFRSLYLTLRILYCWQPDRAAPSAGTCSDISPNTPRAGVHPVRSGQAAGLGLVWASMALQFSGAARGR
jgi:hypothetical protein